MSAPSFSSFPPSFGSFPDLEKREDKKGSDKLSRKDGESREEKPTKNKQPHGDRNKRSHRRGRDNKKIRDGDKRKDGKSIRSERDDEQVKREEDRHARLGATYDVGTPGLFMVDKTGDPMNIVYGGIHGGEIPRYRRVGCEFVFLFCIWLLNGIM